MSDAEMEIATAEVTAKELNVKQKAFCRNIAEGMNKGEAYMLAGFKPKDLHSACTIAIQNLKKVEFLEEVKRQQTHMEQEMDTILIANAYKAAKKQGELIDFSTPSVMASMAKDALDRKGYKAKDELELSGEVNVNILDVIMERKNQAESE